MAYKRSKRCFGLPHDLPAAIVVVLHRMVADREDRLPHLLQRATTLEVHAAHHGKPVEAGHVYIAPPDVHCRILDDVFCLNAGPRIFDPSPASRTDGVALVLFDQTDQVRRFQALERDNKNSLSKVSELEERVTELAQRQKALLKANDDLTMANAELRTSNEQLLINAEEAASSHEEVETLNEEMQATNEELETLNEELQATVEELNTTNDELQSRSGDLERSNATREARISRIAYERDALAKVLESRGELVLITGEKGDVLYVSRALEKDPGMKSLDGAKASTNVKLLDGRSFTVNARDVELDGQRLRVVTLREPS